MNRLTACTLSLMIVSTATLRGGDRLSDAAANGDFRAMKACLAAQEKINEIDKWGWTPLMWAVFQNHESSVKWLLHQGADPQIPSTLLCRNIPVGTTALGLAARSGELGIVTRLLQAKADPTVLNAAGKSPLMYAQASGCDACVALLEGKALPPSSLHSDIHPVIQEPLNDLFIQIDSGIIKSQEFLNAVKKELATELDAYRVRHLICIQDSLVLDSEKDIAAKREAFKPKYILHWSEFAADIRMDMPGMPRAHTRFKAQLKRSGEAAPIWITRQYITGAPVGYGSSEGHRTVARLLLNDLEADLLLKP